MPTSTSTSTTKTGTGKGLQKKVGPLPVWGWAAVVVVGVIVYYVVKKKNSAASTASQGPSAAELQAEIQALQDQQGYGYGGSWGSYSPSQTQGSTPDITIYNETMPGHQKGAGKGGGFAGSGYIHLNPGQAKQYLKQGIPIFYMNPSGQLVRWNGKSALPRGTALYGQKAKAA